MTDLQGARTLAAVLAIALLASCGSPSTPTPGASAAQTADAAGPTSSAASASPTASPVPAPGHELYGYVPYWEMDATMAADVAATPLTTLALFSVTNTSKGAIDKAQTGYKRIAGAVGVAMAAAVHRRGARVELVFTSFGADRNDAFFAKASLQDATIASLAALVGSLGLDGVNVDVEGLDIGLAGAYGDFVGRLHAALVAGDARRTVSVATGGGPTGAAMAAAAVQAGADRVFLMGYDYRTATSSPGATSPVDRADQGRTLTTSLDLYAAVGIPPGRLLLGLPLYGVAWPVAGPGLGAPSTGDGSVWILRQHLDVLTNPAAVPVRDPLEVVDVYFLGSDGSMAPPPASAGGPDVPSGGDGSPAAPLASPATSPSPSTADVSWTAVYVDTPDTLGRKLGLGESRGLAGAGFWAIGYERGLPGYTDLMSRFVAGAVPAS